MFFLIKKKKKKRILIYKKGQKLTVWQLGAEREARGPCDCASTTGFTVWKGEFLDFHVSSFLEKKTFH